MRLPVSVGRRPGRAGPAIRWTGRRPGSAGLEPRFRPVLPSSVRRLELRGIYMRGEMRDIVVEGGRLRILP